MSKSKNKSVYSKDKYLSFAKAIGNDLLAKADEDNNGLFWKTMHFVPKDKKIIWQTSEDIYSGNSGIILFLLELYKHTQQNKYLKAAVDGIRWVDWYCKQNPTEYYALITGRMGVAYTFLQLYYVTGKNAYLQKAVKICLEADKFLATKPKNEYINGAGGTLIGLLHIQAALTQETPSVLREAPYRTSFWYRGSNSPGVDDAKKILVLIENYTNYIIDKARRGPRGLYWDKSPYNFRSLCGFSHGAAGIGFVFLELGHYFRNTAFYWLAEQAFAYENYYYRTEKQNWPDFRADIWNEQGYQRYKKAYLANNLNIFNQYGDMNAWCHGAAGIGLSRLRAYELTNKKKYRTDAENAITKTKKTAPLKNPAQALSYNLCHGSGGNAELFIQAYETLKDKKYLKFAQTIADQAIKSKKKLGYFLPGISKDCYKKGEEDLSLFKGNAGVGYFLLQVHNLEKTPTILAPKLNAKISQKPVLKRYKTLSISLSALKKRVIGDNSPLAQAKLSLDRKNDNHTLLFVKDKINREKAEKLIKLSDKEFAKLILTIDPGVKVLPEKEKKSSSPLLLKTTANGIYEKQISPFCHYTLLEFKTEKKIEDAAEELLNKVKTKTKTKTAIIKRKIIEQIKALLTAGILVTGKS